VPSIGELIKMGTMGSRVSCSCVRVPGSARDLPRVDGAGVLSALGAS
jgi:hypothetical protein